MTSDAPTPAPPGVADGPGGAFTGADAVVEDTPCRRCGYNLRGLPHAGLCPECATPVALSVASNLLRHADPEWLAKLVLGLRVTFWGGAIGLMAFLSRSCLVGRGLASALIDSAAGLALVYGAWLITAPDPAAIDHDRYVAARKVTRVALAIGACGNFIVYFAPPSLLVAVLAACAGVAISIGEFTKLDCLRRLALRVPDERLARRARIVRWVFPAANLARVTASGLIAFSFLVRRRPPPFVPALVLTAVVALFGLLITYAVWLQFQYSMLKVVESEVIQAGGSRRGSDGTVAG
jgi:hypothetical protein